MRFLPRLALPASLPDGMQGMLPYLLQKRSDMPPPKVAFPDGGKPQAAPAPKNNGKEDPTPPLPPTSTVTVTSVSTSLITSTVTSTFNVTWHDLATVATTVPNTVRTTVLITATHNQTIISTPMTVAPTPAPAKVSATHRPNHVAEGLAIASGVVNLALLAIMFFLVRRFYRMYRAERVLRKQERTEGAELSVQGTGFSGQRVVGVAGLQRKDEWGARQKQEWGVI